MPNLSRWNPGPAKPGASRAPRSPLPLGRALSLCIILTLAAGAAGAQTGSYELSGGVDWPGARLSMTISLDAPAAGLRLPAGRSRAEAMLSSDLPALLRPAIFGLAVDSRRSVADAVEAGDISLEDMAKVLGRARAANSRYSRDLRSFSADVDLSLRELSNLFIEHSIPIRPATALSWQAGEDYSGIIIYAQGDLPVHGESSKARLEPCLFPKLWDQDMVILLERNMADPEAQRAWGLVGYADSDDLAALEDRVGQKPLRVLARGLFGLRRTDPVISREDALRILSRPANRRLLEEGRVVIVYGKR